MIVAGIGCSLGCASEELVDLIDASLHEAGAESEHVVALATVDRRAREPGIVAAARGRGWRLASFSAEQLAAVPVPTPSALVAAHVGTPSVAEAAALLGAGAHRLLLAKRRSAHATCALARTDGREALSPA